MDVPPFQMMNWMSIYYMCHEVDPICGEKLINVSMYATYSKQNENYNIKNEHNMI